MSTDSSDRSISIFKGNATPHALPRSRPPAPPWRRFDAPKKGSSRHRGEGYFARPAEISAVNAALLLRRPLLITGKAGTGKSTLAHAVSYELNLGEVLVWPVTSRSTLQQGLYQYDAIARLQEKAPLQSTGQYIRLGPLGAAFATSTEAKPRVVLIDEIDKGDIDLPNDLLHVFETAEFSIPELERLPKGEKFNTVKVVTPDRDARGNAVEVPVNRGQVRCRAFPLVVLTSNGEREFPPAFLRRCLQVNIEPPSGEELRTIINNRLGKDAAGVSALVEFFEKLQASSEVATDQLLNAVYLVTNGFHQVTEEGLREMKASVLRPVGGKS